MNYRTAIIRDAGGDDIVIRFDAILREIHDAEVEITEHPVEAGADVADHARVKLAHLTLEAFVTNHPIDEGPVWNADGASAKFSPMSVKYESNISLPIGIPGAASVMGAFGLDKHYVKENVSVLQSSQSFDRVSHVYTVLEKIRSTAEKVSILTPLKLYDDMVITHLTVPRETGHPQAVAFTIECKQLRFVSTKTGAAVPGKKSSKGQQAAKQVTDDDPQAAVKASFAAKAVDGVVDAVRKLM